MYEQRQFTDPEKRKPCKSTHPRAVFLKTAYLIVFLVLFLTVVVVCVKVRILEDKFDKDPLCIPCDTLVIVPFKKEWPKELDIFSKQPATSENDREMCCADTRLQLSTMMEQLAERKMKEVIVREQLERENHTLSGDRTGRGNRSVVDAHLNGGQQDSRMSPNDLLTRLEPVTQWSHRDPTTYIQGLRLRDNRIMVPESGVYFVYSQLHVTELYEEPASKFEHRVCRYSVIYPNGGEQVLLTSVNTENKNTRGRYSDTTSYLGAVFYLNKSDELYIRSSTLSKLSMNPKTSYFGIFKL